MSAICPKEGCKHQSGPCGHDVAMLLIAALATLASVAHWGLHWV